MFELFECDEVPLKSKDVLLLNFDLFDGIDPSSRFVYAPVYCRVATLPYLFP